MASISARRIKEEEMQTIFYENFQFEGELSFKNNLMIKGHFKGKIVDGGDLFVDKNATIEVDGSLKANSFYIEGDIKGDIEAVHKVELKGKAKVVGNITAQRLIMDPGCVFIGESKMPLNSPHGE